MPAKFLEPGEPSFLLQGLSTPVVSFLEKELEKDLCTK